MEECWRGRGCEGEGEGQGGKLGGGVGGVCDTNKTSVRKAENIVRGNCADGSIGEAPDRNFDRHTHC